MAYKTWSNEQVTDTDLNENFNLTQKYLITDTDTSGSNHTTNSTSPVLKRTFAITGVATTDVIDSITISNIQMSSSGGGAKARLYVELNDGSTTWYLVGDQSTSRHTAWVTSRGAGESTVEDGLTSSLVKAFYFGAIPALHTGSTTWNIKISLDSTDGGQTSTLVKGFSVGLTLHRRMESVGSISDS